MEDLINEVKEYLPINYNNSDNNEYVNYLIDACDKNSLMEKDQFAYIAFHMLYMSYIFKVVWQSNQINHNNIQNRLSNYQSKLGNYENPFDISVIPEKEAIRILGCYGFHINKISQFQLPIENRDHCAHASGFIQYKKNDIAQLAAQELIHIKTIQEKLQPLLANLFNDFFAKNFKPDPTSGSLFPSGLESADLFIQQNIFSQRDIGSIVGYNFSFLNQDSNSTIIIYQKVFFLLVCARYDEMLSLSYENFKKHLPKLMFGFERQQDLYIEDLLYNELYEITNNVDPEELGKLLSIST